MLTHCAIIYRVTAHILIRNIKYWIGCTSGVERQSYLYYFTDWIHSSVVMGSFGFWRIVHNHKNVSNTLRSQPYEKYRRVRSPIRRERERKCTNGILSVGLMLAFDCGSITILGWHFFSPPNMGARAFVRSLLRMEDCCNIHSVGQFEIGTTANGIHRQK